MDEGNGFWDSFLFSFIKKISAMFFHFPFLHFCARLMDGACTAIYKLWHASHCIAMQCSVGLSFVYFILFWRWFIFSSAIYPRKFFFSRVVFRQIYIEIPRALKSIAHSVFRCVFLYYVYLSFYFFFFSKYFSIYADEFSWSFHSTWSLNSPRHCCHQK